MLFNSYAFIFVFLPITWLGYRWLFARQQYEPAMLWLALASLFFYGWWNPVYLLLMLASISFNYWLGRQLAETPKRALLAFGIVANLLLLGYFKYANFFVDSINWAAGTDWHLEHIVLPLAISFFTFLQIAYLVDTWRGPAYEYRFSHYLLFVTFFPHLIAGPLIHHRELMPQFQRQKPVTAREFSVGLSIFFLGLFKKTVLADGVAVYSSPVFQAAERGVSVTLFEAWGGSLAYTLQLYFDFSAYSDMAIGLSLLFGMRMPINFLSPFKSRNMSEFWTRWHITLSRFLRDYLYIPLGGNRHGKWRTSINQFITMVLGGLWHGAGLSFLLWGALHGFYLILHRFWRNTLLVLLPQHLRLQGKPAHVLAIGITFLAWVVTMVLFRAESLDGAWVILQGMCGLNGALLTSDQLWLGQALQTLGLSVEYTPQAIRYVNGSTLIWILLLLGICWFTPSIYETFATEQPALTGHGRIQPTPSRWQWQPRLKHALPLSLIATLALLHLNQVSEFLYFQF